MKKTIFIISPLYINKKPDINNAELVNLVRSELAQGFFTTTCRLSEIIQSIGLSQYQKWGLMSRMN